MARTIKIETQIKNKMQAFIASNGLKNINITIGDDRFSLVTPNHLSQGWIECVSNGVTWVADLKKSDPTKVSTVKPALVLTWG